jgi:hypothetical protein
MTNQTEFQLGDRVRVVSHYFDDSMRGRIGRVSNAPESVRTKDGCHWIELEPSQDCFLPGDIDGLEIEASGLERFPSTN